MNNLKWLLIIVLSVLPFHFCIAQQPVEPAKLKVHINALDLSEDMSIVSSGNDELILIAYYDQSAPLGDPVLTRRVTLDQQNNSDTLSMVIAETKPLLMFLLEQDTNKKLTAIEPILRVYTEQVIEAYNQMDYKIIEKYLNDDDILGVCSYDWSTETTIVEFKSRHKLDKYH
ncbi:MAG: hypothetical protein AAFO69_17880 [Bacteroidota bacterium]